MIQEQYVSFETAKLLKEKGFGEKCRSLYTFWFDEVEGPKEDKAENWNIELKYFSAPTQQMTMAWLREHNIDIIPFHEIFDGDVYWCRIEKKYGNLLHTELQQDPVYKTYEEAVEEAIKYSLENLI